MINNVDAVTRRPFWIWHQLWSTDPGVLWISAGSLTEERKKDRIVVRHDKQINTGQGGAGLEVAKRFSQIVLLPAAANKNLRTRRQTIQLNITATRKTGETRPAFSLPASTCAGISFPGRTGWVGMAPSRICQREVCQSPWAHSPHRRNAPRGEQCEAAGGNVKKWIQHRNLAQRFELLDTLTVPQIHQEKPINRNKIVDEKAEIKAAV